MTDQKASILKNLLTLFLIVIGLYYAKAFLMPLSVGAVVATLILPLCKTLEEKKIPKLGAVMISLFVLSTVIGGVVFLLGWQVSELTGDLTILKQRFIETFNRIQQFIFDHLDIPVTKQMQILKDEQPSVSGVLQFAADSLSSVLTNAILIFIYIFGLLYYREHIKQFVLKLSAPEKRKEVELVINRAAQVSQQYLVGLTKMIVCLWIMYGIGFSILGVKKALFFAVLCGLLEIVPFIGNITGTTITVLVSAVQGASLPMLGGIIATYALIQFIQGWVLEPLIVGKQVKINPLSTIMALLLGEMIWGIPGVFLAIPLIVMFKIVCDHIEPLKPYGFLIGEVETENNETGIVKKIKTWFKTPKHK